MSRDSSLYPEPNAFKPDRFLNLDPDTRAAMDPRNYVFGFGRRICPGMHLVEAAVWLLIANMIATLEIGKARDAAGKEVQPIVEYHNAVFRSVMIIQVDTNCGVNAQYRTPTPFACRIAPRSERSLALLEDFVI